MSDTVTVTKIRIDFVQVGRDAYHAGKPAPPVLDPTVLAATEHLEVGEGAVQIYRAFTRGWDEANLADQSWMDDDQV